jgi:hypothetical protein
LGLRLTVNWLHLDCATYHARIKCDIDSVPTF